MFTPYNVERNSVFEKWETDGRPYVDYYLFLF